MENEKTEPADTKPEIGLANPEWKTPIWEAKYSQLIRILRYSEMKALFGSLDVEDQGRFRVNLGISSDDLALWLQALLFTGMRLSELWKFREHPELLQRNNTILLAREIFYDSGKKKQTAQERVVQLSDMGIKVVNAFLQSARMPRMPFTTTATAIDHILEQTALKLRFQTRVFKYRQRERLPSGKFAYTYRDHETTGIRIRSFRKSWDSWLVNTFGSDPMRMDMIMLSQGHNHATSLSHYLTFGLDYDDKQDIKKAMKGYGGWEFKE